MTDTATTTATRSRVARVTSTTVPRRVLALGLPAPRMVELDYPALGRLNIDETYQRLRIRDWSNTIARSLEAGGTTLPIVLAERPDGTWWIVDGQQRYWAHVETKVPMRALVYKVGNGTGPDLQLERTMYSILNRKRNQTGNNTVKSWPGETAAILREWATKPGSPYLNRINFGAIGSVGGTLTGASTAKTYDAVTLVRVIVATITPTPMISSSVQDALATADAHLDQPGAREKVDAILRLLPLIFPPGSGRLRMLPAVGLASVAHKRWANGVRGQFPTPASQQRLRQINWPTLVPTMSVRFLSYVERAIETRWKS